MRRSAFLLPLLALPLYPAAVPAAPRAGSKACAACHQDIYSKYMRTAMGRSMSVPEADSVRGRITVPGTAPNRFIDVYRDGSSLYQSEYEKTAAGADLYRVTRKLEYAIGSGMNGKTYLTSLDRFLYEAPLSYFTRVNRWELSPGYEKNDSGFNRPILAPCITCHSGQAQTRAAANGRFESPPFAELSIGCENCHGPGQRHVSQGGNRAAIVNPARLPIRLAENICVRCHQSGDAAVLRPGKDYGDFRPGQWLAETLLVFQVPRTSQAGGAEVLDHFNAMNLSRCYRQSQGKLTCTTCHDPHSEPASERAAEIYRTKCLQCHAPADCKLPTTQRNATTFPDDCVSCHMPRRDLRQFSHSALTDHRVPRVPSQPYPDQSPATGPLDLVLVNRPGNDGKWTTPDAALALAYGQLAPAYPQYRARHLELLEKLVSESGKDSAVLAAWGRHELAGGTPESDALAREFLASALRAGNSDPETYQALGDALGRLGRNAEAIDILKSGIVVAPWSEPLYKLLAQQFLRAGRLPDALQTVRTCAERFPEDAFMREMLTKLNALQQKTPP